MESQDQFNYLYDRYLANQATPDEADQLFGYIAEDKNNDRLKEMLGATWDQLQVAPGSYKITPVTIPDEAKAPVRKLIPWKWIAVAASILLIVGLGSYFIFFNRPAKQIEIAKTQAERFKNDVNPGGYKARLTLADGRTIVLDSVVAGELAKQGGTVVLNKDGQLVYDASALRQAQDGKEVLYNTLSTARGETYATVLADGSKVWLNSASSIKYPVAFVGGERKIEITGEAYFEVAKDASKKFIVVGNGITTEVLGTHFNVNTYTDENSINVTLLEGSVKVVKGSSSSLLVPGQQAQITDDIKVVSNVDREQVMAWKNGIFQFDNADVASVMRQISRWYNVDIIYEKPVTKKVSLLNVPRTVTMTNILKIMEMTGNVKFEIEGNNVTVIP